MEGQFYAGDSYLVEYTTAGGEGRGQEVRYLYLWQGRDSTADEKGASAALATSWSSEEATR